MVLEDRERDWPSDHWALVTEFELNIAKMPTITTSMGAHHHRRVGLDSTDGHDQNSVTTSSGVRENNNNILANIVVVVVIVAVMQMMMMIIL